MAERIPARLTAKEGRDFAFPVGGAFALLAVIAFWRHHPVSWRVFAGIAAALLVSGALVPRSLGPVQRAWMRLAHALSKVTTPIFMGVVYFVVLSPIGIVMRAMGKSPLARVKPGDSAWIVREKPSSDLRRQF